MKKIQTENMMVNADICVDSIIEVLSWKAGDFNWTYHPPFQDFATITLILDGSANYYINEEKYYVQKGDIVFCPDMINFHSERVTGIYTYITIMFTLSKNSDRSIFKTIYHIKHLDYYYKLFNELNEIYIKKDYAYLMRLRSGLYNIMSMLIFKNKDKGKMQIIKDSIDYMNDNIFDSSLNIDEISEQSKISATYFRSLFKEIYGELPIRYITNLRLKEAEKLLYYSNITIDEIAEKTGFNSRIYFDRIFKKNFKITPAEFRKGNIKI